IDTLDWDIPIFGAFLYLCIQIGIILIYFELRLIIRRRDIKFHKISPDLFNGLRFLMRIGVTIISVIVLVVFLNVDPDSVLLILGIFTTAILFASMKTINNFIAGVWITLSGVFTVGDYVKFKNVEGIVAEISMNYTKIRHKTNNITQIPNIECLKSKITNYTVDFDYFKGQIERLEKLASQNTPAEGNAPSRYYQDIKSEIEELTQVRGEFEKIQDLLLEERKKEERELSKYVQKNKLVRYTFTLALSKNPVINASKLDEVCNKYRENFRITPDWKVVGLHYKIVYQFVIITPDPEDILEFYDDFLWDLYCIMNQ
ncbi:MAG: mechanosensitive ion channel family protein, partial [Promethearchaeota archaeon]